MYNFMLARDAGYFTINEAKKVIFEKEVPVTDEMRSEAEETLNTYKTMLGDSFASYLQSYGFADEEEYLNNSLLVSLQAQELTKVYVNEKFGDLVSRYSPKKIRIMQFTCLLYTSFLHQFRNLLQSGVGIQENDALLLDFLQHVVINRFRFILGVDAG